MAFTNLLLYLFSPLPDERDKVQKKTFTKWINQHLMKVSMYLVRILEPLGRLYCAVLFFSFLGLYLRHMEVSRLGVKSELLLPAYTTATATQDLSCICDLHHSSWQCQILNSLSKARDGTCVLMDTSRVP